MCSTHKLFARRPSRRNPDIIIRGNILQAAFFQATTPGVRLGDYPIDDKQYADNSDNKTDPKRYKGKKGGSY